MFSYTIAKEADNAAFKKACERIEAIIKDAQKANCSLMLMGRLFKPITPKVERLRCSTIIMLMPFMLIRK